MSWKSFLPVKLRSGFPTVDDTVVVCRVVDNFVVVISSVVVGDVIVEERVVVCCKVVVGFVVGFVTGAK